MSDKIIHVETELHDEFKTLCKERGINMKAKVELLIRECLSKKVVVYSSPAMSTSHDVWSRPPFWAATEKPTKPMECKCPLVSGVQMHRDYCVGSSFSHKALR